MKIIYHFILSLSVTIFYFVIVIVATSLPLSAQIMTYENFKNNPEYRWSFITDQVMGGISSGDLEFKAEAKDSFARMRGEVSLENRGGFIQFRRKISKPLDKNFVGLELSVRGNNEKYFIHLRSSRTFLPWQYYQASFQTGNKWSIVKIPFSKFRKSDWTLPETVKSKNIKSIGVVAYGKEHSVFIDVRKISLY